MKLAFTVLLLVHGLVHGMGFLKAFGLVRLPQLASPISRPLGVLWLVGTWGLSWASFRWVENPLRQRFRDRKCRPIEEVAPVAARPELVSP